jgi:ABC-type multidrug transport system fused ATPase/permease subunit
VHTSPLSRPVTTRTVFRYQRGWFLLRATLAAAVLAARLTVPVMLQGFMKFLECTECAGYKEYLAAGGAGAGPGAPALVRPPRWQGWMWAFGLVGLSLASIVLDAVNTWNTQAHSNTMRMQLGAALSAKALRLGGAEMNAAFGAGRLLNAFSADARRVSELNMMAEFLITAPLVTVVAFVMIGRAVGPVAASFSTAVYILALPLVVSGGLSVVGHLGGCLVGCEFQSGLVSLQRLWLAAQHSKIHTTASHYPPTPHPLTSPNNCSSSAPT